MLRSYGSMLVLVCLLGGRETIFAEPVDYTRQVKPLLTARCYACHGALQQKSGLRVDTAKLLEKGGNGGPAIVARSSQDSPLIERVTAVDTTRMPPSSEGETLSTSEIAMLKSWIDQGAVAPPDESPEASPREHWAYCPPVSPRVPDIPGYKVPSRNAVDAFLAAGWTKRGLSPRPEADRRILLRRAYLDLVGLPPSVEELAAFEADNSPMAYERVVDRLLGSKQYGERWGRHWMDIWRYSDWWGFGDEVRNSQKHIWHWRDWIVESLNADKGYDEMLREMLAADELYPDDPDRLRGTGFLARPYFKFNRNTWLEDIVEHTGKAFLGLTLNCAKCHDHKFDPVSQVDYYRFRAFFETYQLRTDQIPGEVDFEKDGIPRAFDCNPDAPTYRFLRGDERQPVKDRPLKPGLPAILAAGARPIKPVLLPPEASLPGLKPFVLEDHLRAAAARIKAAQAAFEQAKSQLAKVDPGSGLAFERAKGALDAAEKALTATEEEPASLRARAAADAARAGKLPESHSKELARRASRLAHQAALARAEATLSRAELALPPDGDPAKPAKLKERDAAKQALAAAHKALERPDEEYPPLQGALKTLESDTETEASRAKPFSAVSTGRRTALAGWLTDRKNPLAARVAVNHIWTRHFGKPLVPTVFDLGRNGTPPRHPELLDWLAVELMDHDWSMKHLHRLLVTSAAYRRTSSSARAELTTLAVDPENLWYWRMNPLRMESQVVRDAMLHLAGDLDFAIGGPTVSPTEEGSRRRSLYFFHSHNIHDKFLATFDDASVLECYRRSESVVPSQALALSNSRLALTAASRIGGRLQTRLGQASNSQFVLAAFDTILAASPTMAESAECERALQQWSALLKAEGVSKPDSCARENLIRALLNHNDFITIR
jgi:Protein of unknown function (DUF1549)/Protein of unknown function (DUF1553)/Planctomycete cytochrome C